MRKTLAGFRARHRNEAPQETPRPEAVMDGAVRRSAEYLAGLTAPADGPDPARIRLAAAIGSLVTAHAQEATDPFDALLKAGERALDVDGEAEKRLALGIAETATDVRDRSKGAWRLRGLALEALGRDDEAVGAYERHLALQQSAGAGREIALRVATLKELRACLDEAVRLFPEDPADRPLSAGEGEAEVRAAFSEYVGSRLAERGAGDPEVRRLAGRYATYRRLTAQGRIADPLLGGSEPIGLSAFRNMIAGRTVCVVADASANATASVGTDEYDIVIRCDAFRTPAPDSGERTDVHAVTPPGDSPWDGPGWDQHAGTRLIFTDSLKDWRQTLRRRLVPGAQSHVGNASLRRPVSDPGLIGERGWGECTTAFSVLRLLDFLDVSPRIDLIGPGLPGRLRAKEKEWVMAHAKDVDPTGMRTALR